MVLNPKILRAYDIRGVYPSEISEDLFYRFGQGFGTEVLNREHDSVCVGYDGRLSSPALEAALVSGLVSTGLTVHRIGCGPSPLLYYAEKKLKTGGALMVTGSHNPREYNGIKMILDHQPFFGEMIQDFGLKVQNGNFASGQGKIIETPLQAEYLAMLLQDFAKHYRDSRALRIAWDPANGAAGEIVEQLTAALPGEHFVINTQIDGTFPAHHPDPTVPENLEQLRQVVMDKQCDLGIAFDGDADRIGIVDDQGCFLWGDQFLLLFADEILQTNPEATILADVKASQTFFDRVSQAGGKPLMVSTGHSNIKHKMRETGALLAGEMSGHVFFADRYYGYDDALYAAIRMLGIVSVRQTPLSAWRQALPAVVNTPEIKIECEDSLKKPVIDYIRTALMTNGCSFVDIDGVRVLTPEGWWLLRASNTQDYLIARIEANSQNNVTLLKHQMLAYLQEAGIKIGTL
jgi:phosphomannomutase